MKKKVVFLLAMSLLTSVSVFGQSGFEVNGTVVDKATGEAVIGSTIKLMVLPDSSFVEGTTTGAQGDFNLKNVKKGAYALQVSYIGYATKSISGAGAVGGGPSVLLRSMADS